MKRLEQLAGILRRHTAAPCVLCGQLAGSGGICGRCRKLLPWNDVFCNCCGQAMHSAQAARVSCQQCQARRPAFASARAPLIYDFPVDAVLKAIKFKRQLWYVPALAALLMQFLERDFREADALVPVPLHRLRQMRRGFNQALELCRPLHRRSGLPILTQAVRVRATAAQTGLNAAERRRNMMGAFAVRGKLKCRHPLIIDDVMTTGETCSQLAIELKNSGAVSVGVLTVARAYTGTSGLNV